MVWLKIIHLANFGFSIGSSVKISRMTRLTSQENLVLAKKKKERNQKNKKGKKRSVNYFGFLKSWIISGA